MTDWGYFTGGTIHIICSSHNDIAWFDSPAETIRWRDSDAITPALERMRHNPQVTFCMENVLYLLEYLERHPERADEIRALAQAGRFDWGATYNQPLEGLLSGEQLVREVVYGRGLVKDLLGVDARVYYSPDVPGRAMQMPQVLAKAGVDYMLISRYQPSLLRWRSPDGSQVVSWSMGHYVNTSTFARQLDGSVDEVRQKIHADLLRWTPYYQQHRIAPHYAYLYSMDYIPPKDFDQLIAGWNAARSDGDPLLVYSTPERFLDAVMHASPALAAVTGERPDLWVYLHGPTHHHAISDKRSAAAHLPAAELFGTLALQLGLQPYPAGLLRQAWLDSIYDDHGWGGNNGHLTDETFRRRLQRASRLAGQLLQQTVRAIASAVDGGRHDTIAVFNPLSWQRSDIVQAVVTGRTSAFRIQDGQGQPVPYQQVPAGNGLDREIVFVAEGVPAAGYAAFQIADAAAGDAGQVGSLPAGVAAAPDHYENSFYRLEFGAGGIRRWYDKQLGQDLVNPKKFLAGEVFMLESSGYDAHDFGAMQQPTTIGEFEKVSQFAPEWAISETGPVYTSYAFTQQMPHYLLYQQVICYHTLKRIDVRVWVHNWDGIKSRELRLAVPINHAEAEIAYEVPMGVAVVGASEIAGRGSDGPVYEGLSPQWGTWKVGPTYTEQMRDIHPRAVQNFITCSTPHFGVTLTTSTAVFDYLDPTTSPHLGPILQPILLATRRSNHPAGNWYLQAGDHHFAFSLTSHPPGWRNGWRAGSAPNAPLLAVTPDGPPGSRRLPPSASLVSADAANVAITCVKQPGDGAAAVIVRCCEMEGESRLVTFTCGFDIRQVERADLLEQPTGERLAHDGRSFTVLLGPYAIETFRAWLTGP